MIEAPRDRTDVWGPRDFAGAETHSHASAASVPALRADRTAPDPARLFDPLDEPLFGLQWHLLNKGQTGGPAGVDINVAGAWRDYSGAGVAIGIWDDGVEYDHRDLAANHDPALRIRLDDGTLHDPYPENATSRHGTAVAGIIAAAANGEGVAGVAHGARFAGVDIFLDQAVRDDGQTEALRRFDVTNHSWSWSGRYSDGVLDPGPVMTAFFAGLRDSVALGRDGLGTVNVKSAGNARQAGSDANQSNFTSMPETIAVAAVGDDGRVAFYSTPGASLLVSAPSGGRAWQGDAGVWTTDRAGGAGYSNGVSERPENRDPDYTARFNGTSAAAPMVSGIVALMLEANPELGWRDVQEILALSARHVGAAIGADALGGDALFPWQFNAARHWNGGGMHFSNDYGFGLVDARAAVRMAESWRKQQTSDNWRVETAAVWEGAATIPDDDPDGLSVTLAVASDIDLETVGLRLGIRLDTAPDFSQLADLSVTLVSPGGTASILSTPTVRGAATPDAWDFTSNAFRGERASGEWTLTIADAAPGLENMLVLAGLGLLGDDPSNDDTYFFTDAFRDYAGGAFGRRTVVADRNGGVDAIDASAVTLNAVINLATGVGRIDGVAVRGLKPIENALGGDGADVLIGNRAANDLRGGRGNDRIEGGGAADTLHGGPGNDILRGGFGADILHDGPGVDRMWGGSGPDTFVLTLDGDADYIRDFNFRADRLTFLDVTPDQITISNNGRNAVKIDAAGDPLYLFGASPQVLRAAALDVDDFLFA